LVSLGYRLLIIVVVNDYDNGTLLWAGHVASGYCVLFSEVWAQMQQRDVAWGKRRALHSVFGSRRTLQQ
jgi:hypothetical protein